MKIAIAGYGDEGKANYRYYSRLGYDDITIVDERGQLEDLPVGAKLLTGDGVFGMLQGFDLVVRTAGLSPRKIVTDGRIWSSTNEFFAKCPAPIIGVTGTKGKGTTSSLIASILTAVGKTVHLVGNIGVPPLDVLPLVTSDDIVVFEMSSFQLWDIEESPHVAVVLMVEPDHLNVHADFDDYIEAKANIRRFQSADDICIYHPTNQISKRIADVGSGRTIRYGVREDGGAYVSSNTFFVQDIPICSVEALRLPGIHNQENACAAMTAALVFSNDYEAIEQGLRNFGGLPHRLELVREIDGVTYYNDSFSSAAGATVAAIRSFEAPEILIIGGIDKGADFTELSETIVAHKNVKQLILIGEIRHALADFFLAHGVTSPIDISDASTMQEIVDAARSYATPGDIVILSPACASFDMFKNFYDRGDQFRSIVQSL